MKIIGDAREIEALKKNISKCMLRIVQEVSYIEKEMLRLGGNWDDDGYQPLFHIVSGVLNSVHSHVEAIYNLRIALQEYADILNRETGQGNNYGKQYDGVHAFETMQLFLTSTKETWKQTADGMIYDHPVENRAILDLDQGKVSGFKGTCGICSCVNVLRLAGVHVSEKELVKFAAKNHLCERRLLGRSKMNGGTSADDRQEILRNFGLETIKMPSCVDSIAQVVSEGRGVIVSVRAERLWGVSSPAGFHAVTVTSVKKDFNGNIRGFYIADSGVHGQDGDGYYSREVFEKALSSRPMNVTSQIIR